MDARAPLRWTLCLNYPCTINATQATIVPRCPLYWFPSARRSAKAAWLTAHCLGVTCWARRLARLLLCCHCVVSFACPSMQGWRRHVRIVYFWDGGSLSDLEPAVSIHHIQVSPISPCLPTCLPCRSTNPSQVLISRPSPPVAPGSLFCPSIRSSASSTTSNLVPQDLESYNSHHVYQDFR